MQSMEKTINQDTKERLEFIKNQPLLNEYFEILAGVRDKFGKGVIGELDEIPRRRNKEELMKGKEPVAPEVLKMMYERRRENALYIIGFVFKKMYGIETLEDAKALLEETVEGKKITKRRYEEIWQNAKLDRLINGRYVTIESVVNVTEYKRHYICDKEVLLYIVYSGFAKDMTAHLFEIYSYMVNHTRGAQKHTAKIELERIEKYRKERGVR